MSPAPKKAAPPAALPLEAPKKDKGDRKWSRDEV